MHLDVAAELVECLDIADRRQQIAHSAAVARAQNPEAHDLAIGSKTRNRILVVFIDDCDVVDGVVGPDRLPDLDPALRSRRVSPAMIPATWVPWPTSSTSAALEACASVA